MKLKVLTREYGMIELTADSYGIDSDKTLHLRNATGKSIAAFREWIGVVPVGSE